MSASDSVDGCLPVFVATKTAFAIDCLGEIALFISSVRTLNNLRSTCKAFRHLLEVSRPGVCRNISFKLLDPQVLLRVDGPLQHVHRLEIVRRDLPADLRDTLSDDAVLGRFPNLVWFQLTLRGGVNSESKNLRGSVSSAILKSLPKLEVLSLSDCSKVWRDSDFVGSGSALRNLRNLRSLKIENPSFYPPSHDGKADVTLTGSVLKYTPNLDTLELNQGIGFKDADLAYLASSGSLRKLVLSRTPGVTSASLEHVGKNLRVLNLTRMDSFGFDGFGFLTTSLEVLNVIYCNFASSKQEVCQNTPHGKLAMEVQQKRAAAAAAADAEAEREGRRAHRRLRSRCPQSFPNLTVNYQSARKLRGGMRPRRHRPVVKKTPPASKLGLQLPPGG